MQTPQFPDSTDRPAERVPSKFLAPESLAPESLAPELLDRVFTGSATRAEQEEVEARLGRHPEVVRALASEHLRTPSPDTLWANYSARGSLLQPTNSGPARTTSERSSRWKSLGLATGIAMTALVVTLGGISVLSSRGAHNVSSGTRVATATGEMSSTQLAPGITAILAPQTQLEYRETSDGDIVAELTGEAYFNVAAEAKRPFTVKSHGVETRVLGTAFNVRRYPDDATTQVSVVSGKVSVHPQDGAASVVVTPGMVVNATDSVATVTSTTSARNTIAWVDGRLVFDNVTVPTLLSTLGKWYGYRFTYADSVLATKRVSTTVVLQRSQETLSILKDLLNVEMEFQDSVIVLRENNRRRHDSSAPPARKTVIELPTRAGK